MELNRRDFFKGAGVAAASVAALGVVGCSPAPKASNSTSTAEPAKTDYKPDETMDVDIVVVGSGSSGVAATVQAAELGAKTLLLEKEEKTGGNGRCTEGMFAINSKMQKDAGIGADVTFRDIIAAEQEFFNYRINNLLWKDMVDASGENLDWMQSHGVKFSGDIDDYHGLGKFKCFHWFGAGENGKIGSGSCYIDPMIESAQKLGATVMTATPVQDLIIEDGKVKGVWAKKKDGKIIKVNAKAVILTSGGYVDNEEMMKERGYDLTYSNHNGVAGHDGDGLRMAISAGANDVSRERCFLREPYSYGIDFFADMSQSIHRGGPVLWVNQDSERYTNEDCGSFVPQCNGNAVHSQAHSYMVMSQDMIDEISKRKNYPALQADMDDAVSKNPGENIYKADTIEELAKLQKLDPATLKKTVDRYNELCAKKVDDDFNKDPKQLIPCKTAPFYVFRQDMAFWTSIGGIDTNRKMEVLTPKGETVPGLYAAGTDGCNLYRETYTMSVPASANANNCNSGRVAAKNAYETCVKA